MTVNTQTVYVLHRGNGAAVTFPYNFRLTEPSMVRVSLRDYNTKEIIRELLHSEYIITGVDLKNYSGGSVTYPIAGTPISSNVEILIERVVTYTQELVLLNEGGFFPEAVEYQFDKIVFQIQQLYLALQVAVKVPVGETPPTFFVTEPNKLLYLDPAGVVKSSNTPLNEVDLRIAGDEALGKRIDSLLSLVAKEADRADQAANRAEAARNEAEHHAQVSHDLVEAAVAGFQGFNDGMAYDFGWLSSDMTYFNRDWGTL